MASKKKAVWLGVILDDPSKLLAWWQKNVGPVMDKHHAHHSTVVFKPTMDDVLTAGIGDFVRIKVVGVVHDNKVQAVVVDGFDLPGRNRMPHITVATDGTSPAYSNDLIATGYEEVDGPMLSGRVGFFDGSTDRFDFEDTEYESERMSENPIWIWPAMIGGAMVAGALVWNSLSSQGGPGISPEQAAAQARAAALVQRASLQEGQSNIVYLIPVMVGLGALLLWKSRQAETEYEEW